MVIGSSNVALPSVSVDCGDGDTFCLAKARNQGLAYCERSGFDWALLLDADIVVERAPSVFPAVGIACPKLAWVYPQTDFHAIPDRHWMRSQFFLLHRWHFRHRFDEEFVGYGHEENDFENNVFRDVVLGATDCRVLHLDHAPLWARQINHANTKRYEARRS